MRRFLYALGFVAALAGGVAVSAGYSYMHPTVALGGARYMHPPFTPAVAVRPEPAIKFAAPKTKRLPVHKAQPSDVEIMLDAGLGSGVHIGDGLFLTAAHVVDHPSKRLDVKLRDKSLRAAKVLWMAKDYDIALLSADGKDVDSSKLACRDVKVGEAISAIGNPLGIESITAFGRVAGETRQIGDRPMYVMDMTVVMGSSGGPIFDEKDEIVGIADAIMVAPLGDQAKPTPSIVGYSYAVPSSIICKLLARAA